MLVWFRRLVKISLVNVFLVIAAGGIVRMTGSGMGCPDWPKCFGQYIPPTDVSQLPADYKEIFKVQGKEIADFSAFKTWTEYINRLVGALLGLFLLITTVIAAFLWKKDKWLFLASFFILLLTAFQAWLGALVVASNLAPVRITTHMVVALIIAALVMWLLDRVNALSGKSRQSFRITHFRGLLFIAMCVTLVQVAMGTQVREEIDHIAASYADKSLWIQSLSLLFYVHRSFSILVLGLNVFIIYQINRQIPFFDHLPSQLVAISIFLSIFSGVMLNYAGFPAFAQPIHLFAGAVLFTAQYAMFLQARRIQAA
ncbi:MAG: COX15/CtaA family protein [Flavobacteriales bacterium]